MTISKEILTSIEEGLSLLPEQMRSNQARVMLYAIGLQESKFLHRRQITSNGPVGPAKGFWQFERGGGCKGVITHPASRYWMNEVCKKYNVGFDSNSIWNALQTKDAFAAATARLLLFTDPKSLPAIGDKQGAWDLYLRVWRPGKPHYKTWSEHYAEALMTIT